MNQKSFIFIGRSGCGKGTQAKLLSDYLKKIDPTRDVLYIQTGEHFREFIKGPSYTQKISRAIYDVGGLQPEFLAVFMWANVFVNKFTKNEHIIMDGTPRKLHEAGVLDSAFKFYGLEKPIVINIDISKNESIDRLMARKRFDDNREDIEMRLSWYETDVVPALEYYKNNKNYQYVSLDGNRSIEEIHKDIISLL
ncbi:MAG: nucleoside monophosphate kinase [Candidatus Taylorbacteria bacterium]|nr:nucleoside monophosphate kinase [Candidatus Taylorbacteria bacterium]